MIEIGAVCGRFQIFHSEHLEYVLAAKERCEHLIIGITSPDKSVSPVEMVDINRGKDEANPCTYYERMKMIERVLLDVGIKRKNFDIVPFPVGKPELLRFYIPKDTCIFITILDEWGHCKKERLQEQEYLVDVLWEKEDKLISSTMIRKCIALGLEWKQFVPDATYDYITTHGIDLRIKNSITL